MLKLVNVSKIFGVLGDMCGHIFIYFSYVDEIEILREKYPDVAGELYTVDLVKGDLGLGKHCISYILIRRYGSFYLLSLLLADLKHLQHTVTFATYCNVFTKLRIVL